MLSLLKKSFPLFESIRQNDVHITELRLANVGDDDVEYLAEALSANRVFGCKYAITFYNSGDKFSHSGMHKTKICNI